MTDQAVRLRGSKNDFLIDFDHAGEDKKRDFLANMKFSIISAKLNADPEPLVGIGAWYRSRAWQYIWSWGADIQGRWVACSLAIPLTTRAASLSI